MFEQRSEILKARMKFFSDKANEKDMSQFTKVFNQKATDGQEFVTYTYMAEVIGTIRLQL